MKRKVGLMTFSDGRKYVHEDLLETNLRYQSRLASTLESKADFDVVQAEEIVWTAEIAQKEARRLSQAGVELTIFNYAIWAYPHLTGIASRFAPGPYILFSNLHPSEPGMVAMLAAAGLMDQIGERYIRIWGDIEDDTVFKQIVSYTRSATSISRLDGQTFGLFGGRAMGMYTAVSNQDQWLKTFGINVEHFEQYDIVRYSEKVNDARVEDALQWLEKYVGDIKYDDNKLTRDKLRLQIRSYHAFRDIIEENGLDFVGTKAHGDLTDWFVTLDIAEAFLNDPYDWEGAREPIVAATEADMDGALTMQIMKHITGEPVLFADVRHYDSEDDIWYFSNSGTHTTYFAGKSYDPEVNLRNVTFYPEVSYYPAGGASVHHFAAPGQVTLARLARKDGQYWMAIVPGEFVEFPLKTALAKSATVTPEWPVAFSKLKVSPDKLLSSYPCNHVHGVYGDWTDELCTVAELLGIDFKVYD